MADSNVTAEGAAAPVTDAEFAAWMAALGPFEPAPHVGVAVSGGPDSLALTLLMDGWARARGGAVRAFTVDHGLRAESASEAAWVGARLAAHGIAHKTLVWWPDDPARVRQAEARAARYACLEAACAEAGLLHLALGHHRDDRAETVLLRVRAGSGPAGLAALPAVRETAQMRLIRPLLGCDKARLTATLAARGESWCRDPGNADPAQARGALRHLWPALAAEGVTVADLDAIADLMGRARRHVEAAVDAVLADSASVSPLGYALVTPAPMLAAPAPMARAALGRVLSGIGGGAHPPRTARLDRALAGLRADPSRARTLGGCRIVPWRGRWLVVRETGRVGALPLAPGRTAVYDDCFEVVLDASASAGLYAAPLGAAGWREIAGDVSPGVGAIPVPARGALPAIWDAAGLREVPGLGWLRPGDAVPVAHLHFVPCRALTNGGFTVVPGPRHTMSLI